MYKTWTLNSDSVTLQSWTINKSILIFEINNINHETLLENSDKKTEPRISQVLIV